MASSTLLQIVGSVQNELGLFPAATTVQSATDDTVLQMLALLNRVGDDVAGRKDWSNLMATGTVSVVNGTDTYALPADFKAFIPSTEWDLTNHWELIGPVSPQEWQYLSNAVVTSGPRRRFRLNGRTSQIQIFPMPGSTDAGASLSYAYRSKYWASAAAGTAKAKFTLDSDTCVFTDEVMITGLKYRFFKAKGFGTDDMERDHELAVRQAMAQDNGAKTLSIVPGRGPALISSANVRDGNFGS